MNVYILITCIFSAICVVFLHEAGHIIAAKLLKLRIDKIGFSYKPFPRFYVSIIDHKLTMNKRILFLLSGNAMVLAVFLIYMILGITNKYIYYVIALQILIDTNPIYSDYVIAISSYIYKRHIRKRFFYMRVGNEESADAIREEIKEKYTFSLPWYCHVLVWGGLCIVLLSNHIVLKILN